MKKILLLCISLATAFLFLSVSAHAATFTFTGNGDWYNTNNWAGNALPSSTDDADLLPGLGNGAAALAYVDSGSVTVNSVTINPTNGSAASAGYIVGAGALNVTGAITVGGTGTTTTFLQFNNTGALNAGSIDFSGSGGASQQQYLTLAAGGSLTVGGGTGTITHSGNSSLYILGRSATPTTINANIYSPFDTYLNAGDQQTGAITIGSGKTWEVFVTRVAFNLNGSPKSGTLTIDGGYLKSQALYILQSSSGTNISAVLNLNNGGTIETFDIARAVSSGSSLTFNWNDGTIRGYGNGANTQLRSVDANPLVVSIAGTGNHTFQVQGNETTTVQSTAILADKIGENGTINKTGAGTLDIRSVSTYTGGTTISAGQLTLSTAGALSTATALDLAGATARFDIASMTAAGSTNGSLAGVAGSVVNLGAKNLNVGGNNVSTTFAGILTNTGSLTKSGTGTLTLSGANTYSGGTLVGAGTLRLSDGGSVAGNITNNAALLFNRSDATTVTNAISGTGALTKAGNGTITLSGSNSYAGATLVSGGTLALNSTTGSAAGLRAASAAASASAASTASGVRGATQLAPPDSNDSGVGSAGTSVATHAGRPAQPGGSALPPPCTSADAARKDITIGR
jgi:autotransporter-associated beta strand protein